MFAESSIGMMVRVKMRSYELREIFKGVENI